MLRGHIDISGVLLFTQYGQMTDDIDGVDVPCYEAQAFVPLFEPFHHLFYASLDVFGGGGLLDEFVELFGELFAS